ncbi:hypothetical protein R3X27_18875 [Tropicimonas sp. TH_r6]|uniref:hypothetical protein n=1 Tax=Tropicimonas sp. TH_r6 TaxID=3082085 RepID=UPI0029543427|nr:hypothetical protein [Tropicimonas sp. TH_r6]MDV7144750.1 hypothetical protein [Tropicimonas sp. TH_r6]
MITFNEIHDDQPELDNSPLLRGAEAIFCYFEEHGPIGLTKAMAFKRDFVTWAVPRMGWPGYSEAELYAVNKVLNEDDVPPLELLHFLFLELRLGRHFKGQFRLTKAGQNLGTTRGKLFGVLTPFFLFHVDHSWLERFGSKPVGKWEIWLNVINVEAERIVSGRELFEVFYGKPAIEGVGAIREESAFYSGVLRPLVWSGLLAQVETEMPGRWRDASYAKTPLWYAVLTLDTDAELARLTRH